MPAWHKLLWAQWAAAPLMKFMGIPTLHNAHTLVAPRSAAVLWMPVPVPWQTLLMLQIPVTVLAARRKNEGRCACEAAHMTL